MADVQPLRALHYDLDVTGPLGNVAAPPYDVIDPEQRAELAARSPYNVVHVDLPEAEAEGADPYEHAAELFASWRKAGAVVHDPAPALWVLAQEYRPPSGGQLGRHGFLARVRLQEYGPGTIRPHERTHPGPREDRLRLTRATKANLSPIFSLYPDPGGAARGALDASRSGAPFGELTDDEGTVNRLWRAADPAAIAVVQRALAERELLIAAGHRRYDTAPGSADERSGDGPHRHVLMCLVGLGYARTDAAALASVRSGRYDAAFFMRATPIDQVRAVAASGENMPPKSTFFHPKVPTGLVFNALDDDQAPWVAPRSTMLARP